MDHIYKCIVCHTLLPYTSIIKFPHSKKYVCVTCHSISDKLSVEKNIDYKIITHQEYLQYIKENPLFPFNLKG